jgi:glycosyltransferase involved in cell wall biosynthesis
MKRVGIDARLYFQTGVGTYIRNVLHYLQKNAPDDIEFYVYVMKNDASRISFNNPQFIKQEVSYKWHSFSEQIGFLKTLNSDKLDLMHFTYFSHPVLYNRPFIATIHDIILLEHKTGKASTLWPFLYNLKHLAFTYAFQHQVHRSKLVVTPSETVKQQLLTIFGQEYSEKIKALHEGVDYEKMLKTENTSIADKFKKKFFLYVGNFYPHKNVKRLLIAFSQIKEDVQLVLVGPDDYFFAKMKSVTKELGIEEKVVLYPNAPDEDLIYLYKHGLAMVHPSLSEGFGLPVIEAQYFGMPVIASEIPVFREILGNDYVAFDPKNATDIKEKIEQFLKTPKSEEKQSYFSDFSFEKMTDSLLQIYKHYLG